MEESQEEETPSLKEIEEIIRDLKNNKSAGEDFIQGELIKYGGTSK